MDPENLGANPANLAVNPEDRRVSSVAVKLPEFWRSDPAMWFAQAEAQFSLAGVVRDHTKFYHIVAKVDQTVLSHISDLVANPPETNKYKAVKDRLISRFELSAQVKLERLLGSYDLGDMRPTHLLAKMRELAANLQVTDDLLKMLFLQRMPQHIRAVLVVSDGDLSNIAEKADKMVECSQSTAAISMNPAPNTKRQEVALVGDSSVQQSYGDLQEQISLLSAEVRRLKTRSTPNNRSASDRSEDDTCWYHKKFGNRASRCRVPCKFSKN